MADRDVNMTDGGGYIVTVCTDIVTYPANSRKVRWRRE